MTDKQKKAEKQLLALIENQKKEYAEWQNIYEFGCHDPFYSDGVNLNLLRNHIIYWNNQMQKLCDENEFSLPDICFEEIPIVVDSDYMARQDEIRTNAKVSYTALSEDENYLALIQCKALLSPKQRQSIYIDTVIGYVSSLKTAIDNDNLIDMRRYENPKHYQESFAPCLEKANTMKKEEFQLSFFDFV